MVEVVKELIELIGRQEKGVWEAKNVFPGVGDNSDYYLRSVTYIPEKEEFHVLIVRNRSAYASEKLVLGISQVKELHDIYDAMVYYDNKYRTTAKQGIDWEQRRYEIAKDLLCRSLNKTDLELSLDNDEHLVALDAKYVVENILTYVDALITKLKQEEKR